MSQAHSTGASMVGGIYVVTGPTSGIGFHSALALAKYGTVALVGRDRQKLEAVQEIIESQKRYAVPVVCDLADPESVKQAAVQILALRMPIAGVLNNAGIFPVRAEKTGRGWDKTFATNHLGPFALTDLLVPHLPDGANVVFVCSAAENQEKQTALETGFRGARYLSAEASARGEWMPGGSALPGADAYATSKQCNLATVMALSREHPRLRFNAVEPGYVPATNLARGSSIFGRLFTRYVTALLAPYREHWNTPQRAAQVLTQVLLNPRGSSGVYYDKEGCPTTGSQLVSNASFQDRVVAETRGLLSSI